MAVRPEAAARRPIVTVQYLRGAACLAVVAFHVLGGSDGSFYVGQAGVDVFFLISGFIMWTVTARREPAPLPFLWRRVTRIVPLYWGITLLVFARRAAAGTATGADLAYSLLFIPHRMSDGGSDPLLIPGWTLNYEVFFYLVFAACLAVSPARRLALAAAVLAGLVAVGGAFGIATLPWSAYTDPLLLEFLLGAGLGAAYGRLARWPGVAGAALAAAGVAGMVALQLADSRVIEWRALLFGGPAAAILAGALVLERRTPAIGGLLGLGDASYAIYLVHVPVMSLLLRIVMPLPLRLFVVIVASVAAGWLLHALETRITRWLRRRVVPAPLAPTT